MTRFSADWLSRREPHDLRARNPFVLAALTASLKHVPCVRIIDLACGTGSTLRKISSHLPPRQRWQLVDSDLDLLTHAMAMPRLPGVAVVATPLDLNRDLESALDESVDLVTTSALLDLISKSWLERLVVEISTHAIPFYAALSYDGRIWLSPRDPLDVAIIAAFNAHQRTDKGFGPALGPAAAAFAIARFKAVGYSVIHGTSDWHIGLDDHEMQNEILAGWASAAHEMGKLSFADTSAWLTRRRDLIAAGRSFIHVGHVDFFATPISMR